MEVLASTQVDPRDDQFADVFWCCSSNAFASGSEARMRMKEKAPYDFSPPPTSTNTSPRKKSMTSVAGITGLKGTFSPIGKKTRPY